MDDAAAGPEKYAEDGRMIGVFSGSIRPDNADNPDEINFFYPIRYFWERFTQRSDGAGPERADGD